MKFTEEGNPKGVKAVGNDSIDRKLLNTDNPKEVLSVRDGGL